MDRENDGTVRDALTVLLAREGVWTGLSYKLDE